MTEPLPHPADDAAETYGRPSRRLVARAEAGFERFLERCAENDDQADAEPARAATGRGLQPGAVHADRPGRGHPTREEQHSAPATAAAMRSDSELALVLAEGRAVGEAADVLRDRLRRHLRDLAGPAEAHAARLADGRARDIVEHTIRHAHSLARDTGGNPAVMLRLLAKATTILLRYAQEEAQRTPRGPADGSRPRH
ncbi:hypothetical protein [Streptomyces sp. NPDC003090]|uniref:hypothetical protein n=1 Tax=Streptomyces sp. NPDC003090 TaxID=3154274 RepID=UPI00382C8835